jgi:peptide deformylase
MVKIVQDISILRQKSENITSIDEAKELISKLEEALGNIDNGVGLASIQLGFPKKLGVIKKADGSYFHLINPELIEKEDEFIYFNEGCLSFPGLYKSTKRYKQITVKHQVIRDNKFEDEIFVAYYSSESNEMGNDGLTAIAIQHEMDHFSGTLIIDSDIKSEPIVRSEAKVGRNDPCPCRSGKKYKKCCLK